MKKILLSILLILITTSITNAQWDRSRRGNAATVSHSTIYVDDIYEKTSGHTITLNSDVTALGNFTLSLAASEALTVNGKLVVRDTARVEKGLQVKGVLTAGATATPVVISTAGKITVADSAAILKGLRVEGRTLLKDSLNVAGNLIVSPVQDSVAVNNDLYVATSLNLGSLFTSSYDVNSSYFNNNVRNGKYIGTGYATRMYLDKSIGVFGFQQGTKGYAGGTVTWRTPFRVDTNKVTVGEYGRSGCLLINDNSSSANQLKIVNISNSTVSTHLGNFYDQFYLSLNGYYDSGWKCDDATKASVNFYAASDQTFSIQTAPAATTPAFVTKFYVNGSTNCIGVGTTTPGTKLGQAQFSADAVGSYHSFDKSRHATQGSHTIVQDNDAIGGLQFRPSDGTDFGTVSAQIWAEVDDAAPAASSIGGALVFNTAAGAASDDLTERMRIDKDGTMTLATGGALKVGTLQWDVTGTDSINGANLGARTITGSKHIAVGTIKSNLVDSVGVDGLVTNVTAVATYAPFAAPTFTGLVKRSVTAGITAVSPGIQGDGALVSDINEVSVCGTTLDAVTLPTAIAGLEVMIINNGAQTLEIFPASADNLGAGVNVATTLIAGANITFVAYDATNWEIK